MSFLFDLWNMCRINDISDSQVSKARNQLQTSKIAFAESDEQGDYHHKSKSRTHQYLMQYPLVWGIKRNQNMKVYYLTTANLLNCSLLRHAPPLTDLANPCPFAQSTTFNDNSPQPRQRKTAESPRRNNAGEMIVVTLTPHGGNDTAMASHSGRRLLLPASVVSLIFPAILKSSKE